MRSDKSHLSTRRIQTKAGTQSNSIKLKFPKLIILKGGNGKGYSASIIYFLAMSSLFTLSPSYKEHLGHPVMLTSEGLRN